MAGTTPWADGASLPTMAVPLAPTVPGGTTSSLGSSSEAQLAVAPGTNGAARTLCTLERFKAAFEPLRENAMAQHSEAAGKEGVERGLRALYSLVAAGDLQGPLKEKLTRLVTAVETRNIPEANQAREQIVRTTTVGWVEGGTWQWVLKNLIAAAQEEAPTPSACDGGIAASAPGDQDVSPETLRVIARFGELLAQARNTLDAKKCDDIAKRLDDLYTALRNGFVTATTVQHLVAVAQATENGDVPSAQRSVQEIAKTDFQDSKSWLPALKQLLR